MQQTKLGANLRAKLVNADPSSRIRVVASITQYDMPSFPSPANSQSRAEYRRQLSESQKGVQQANAAVIQRVQALGLQPGGGVATGTFYVDALPGQISAMTEIDGIATISLDREIDLIRPKRTER